MARPSTIVKRTTFVEADFHVGDNGSVKLVDPPDRRLTYDAVCGHPTVMFGGFTYFVADLVARAHLGSTVGFISFRDGDRTNCRPENLVVDTADFERQQTVALMTRKREPVPLRHDRDRLWWRENTNLQPPKAAAA